MKTTLIFISSLLMVALVSGSVFAWGQGRGHGMGFGNNQDCPRFGGPNSLEGLSQEKKDALTALQQKFIDDTYETRNSLFQKRHEIKMLMETSEPDRTTLGDLSEEIMTLQKELRDKTIDSLLAAKKIAPELRSMGQGFGKNRDRWSGRGCQKKWQKGQNKGCPYN